MLWPEDEAAMRSGFAALFAEQAIGIDAWDPHRLALFPEMDDSASVPEITERCWAILNNSPDQLMCAHSRMVMKRAGADAPVVVSCTLHPYEDRVEMGASLADANRLGYSESSAMREILRARRRKLQRLTHNPG
jgi:hypothetical protein